MKNFTLFLFISLFLIGCSSYNNQIIKKYDAEHYIQTYKMLQNATKKKNNNWLLWKMQSGFLTFSYFGPHFSINDLEIAEQRFKIYENEGLLASIGANIGATFTNDMIIPYRGFLFEGSLLNFYKALAFSSVGDYTQARIEFNRANDRQRRAKDYYKKEIEQAYARTIDEAHQKNIDLDFESSVSDSQLNEILDSKYSNLKFFSIYKDLINPIIPYLSGLFFMIEQDYNKSSDLLKEAYGISRAEIIADDINMLMQRKNMQNYEKFTWIIVEDGNMGRKSSFKTSLPIVGSIGLNAIHIALPYIKDGQSTYNAYMANGMHGYVINDMTKLFASEFEKQLPSIITRAIVGSIIKFGITHSLNASNREYGVLLGLLATLTFNATTMADIRTSFVLPNQTWAIKIPNTESQIKIFGNNKNILTLEFADICNTLEKRKESKKNFDILLQTKEAKEITKIETFKQYSVAKQDNKLCRITDNIVYVRTHNNTVIHNIIKGD